MAFRVFHPSDIFSHPAVPGHPERAHRLAAVMSSLKVLPYDKMEFLTVSPTTLESAQSLHDQSYLNKIAEPLPPKKRSRQLDGGDTTMGPDTMEAALTALGSALAAVDDVQTGVAEGAFVAARPPGHHACKSTAMGFCVLGTAALAAKHAQSRYGSRVALLDFDLHHGNGSQDLLWEEKDIFFASTHQEYLWPGTGSPEETGAHDQIMNIVLPMHSGSDAARKAWSEIFERVEDFNPDIIIVSAGFDAHEDDPMSRLEWSIDDYAWLGEQMSDLATRVCHGRLVSILEGGYDLSVLHTAVHAFLAPFVYKCKTSLTPAISSARTIGPDNGGLQSPYLVAPAPPVKSSNRDRFVFTKHAGSLWILDQKNGALVYTVPDFMKINSRDALVGFARQASARGELLIQDIIEFEHGLKRAYGANQRTSPDFPLM